MKLCVLLFSICSLSVLTSICSSQEKVSSSLVPQLAPGIVIERVEPRSEGERAGLHRGDVLFVWTRGDATGQLASPFDLALIELEQAPKGNVLFEGVRGTQRLTWTVGPDAWGLDSRPNLQGDLLAQYRHAEELASAGRFEDATGYWRSLAKQTEASQNSANSWLAAWMLFHAAATLDAARRYSEADESYDEAVQSAGTTARKLRAQLFRSWAASFERRRNWSKSETYLRQAATEDAQDATESLLVAKDLYRTGLISQRQMSLDKARDYYLQALDMQSKLAPGSIALASSLAELANLESMKGNLRTGEEYCSQSLSILKSLAPAGPDMAAALNTLGLINARKGDLARADSFLYQSLSIKQRLFPESLEVAETLRNIGNVAWAQDDLAKAGEYYRHSLKIHRQLAPDSLGTAYVLNNLGMLACMSGDHKAGEMLMRQALELKTKLAPESITVAASISNLAESFKDLGESDKADEYFKKALAIEEKLSPNGNEVAMTLHSLGELWAQQDRSKAEDYFRKELTMWERLAPGSTSHAAALAGLASVVRNGQPEAAIQLYEQALDALEMQVARLGGSENVVRDFRANHAAYYSEYLDLLVQQKQPTKAFAVLERSRARVLLEALAAGHVNIRNGVNPGLLSLEQSLLAEIATKSNRKIELSNAKPGDPHISRLDSEVTGLLSQYQEVEEKIRSSSPAYAALTQPRILSVEEVQRLLLDNDTCLLGYSLGEVRSYVFVVTTNSLAVFPLPRRSEIESLARAVYENLTARNHVGRENDRRAHDLWIRADKKYAHLAAELSDMILGPVGQLLSKYKRLLVVSDGLLQYIPIAALPAPSSSTEVAVQKRAHPTTRAAVPLVLEHEIVILPSASVMSELRREEQNRSEPPGAIAVLADPVFDAQDPRVVKEALKRTPVSIVQRVSLRSGSSDGSLCRNEISRSASEMGFSGTGRLTLKRLDYTRQEARSILAVTQGKTLRALDFDASRETAMSPSLAKYRFIHFATHGILNSKHPELSGLVFSMVDKRGRPQEGFLSLQDVYDMTLPVDLVVLSGCETGLGKETRSEGLIGLTRGFMYAGSTRVVASLWNISDQATAELMAGFYRSMERDKKPPAAALRAAQIEMWRKDIWKSPYYWAAFQIQGEWK